MVYFTIRIFLLLVLLTGTVYGQSFKKQIKEADKYYEDGYYQEATNLYLSAQKQAPDDLELTLKIGLAYLKGRFKDRALPYLLKVYEELGDDDPALTFQLGLAYQYNHQFIEALDLFIAYRDRTEKYLSGRPAHQAVQHGH